MPRFQPFWTHNSPSYPDCTGYRIRDTLLGRDVGWVSAMPGKDRTAKRDQELAFRLANAQCAKLEATV